MRQAKLIVMYPVPTDVDAFEACYQSEHVPMVVEKMAGKTRFIAAQVVSKVDGEPSQFYRIAEVDFPSIQVLKSCLNSPGGQEVARHAVEISTGGSPVFLISEVETIDF